MGELLIFWRPELEKSCPEYIIPWAFDTFGSDVAFAPSWNEEDVMIHSLFDRTGVKVPIVEFIHDLLSPEKWAPLSPEEATRKTFDGRSASAALWERFHVEHRCKKSETTVRQYRAWIVSDRRSEDPALNQMPVLSWNERFGVFRIAPLARCRVECLRKKLQGAPAPYDLFSNQETAFCDAKPITLQAATTSCSSLS